MKKVHFINNLPKNKENNEIHMLPCSISFSGSTDTNEYFYKKMNQINEKKDEFRNSYLGREIFGKKTPISAAIYERGGESEMNVKYYQMQKFDDILIWEHDKLPENDYKLHELLRFSEILANVNKEI